MKHEPGNKFCVCANCITLAELEKKSRIALAAERRMYAAQFLSAMFTLAPEHFPENAVSLALNYADDLIQRTAP